MHSASAKKKEKEKKKKRKKELPEKNDDLIIYKQKTNKKLPVPCCISVYAFNFADDSVFRTKK